MRTDLQLRYARMSATAMRHLQHARMWSTGHGYDRHSMRYHALQFRYFVAAIANDPEEKEHLNALIAQHTRRGPAAIVI